eukprot:Protomagalhaensia_sp_Gyna_25__5117@NODE_591_length_3048_cov_9_802925_g458_i0_p4_GENE_NODE_591_length_3048_cov_9_802925_g458_i0NODE_591_length_3048_cov_9_802925_g458_i0_p4_ORF_typecomplete_len122_score4_84_NODE_591_length_3048_cov_9_802925_g458_i014691834
MRLADTLASWEKGSNEEVGRGTNPARWHCYWSSGRVAWMPANNIQRAATQSHIILEALFVFSSRFYGQPLRHCFYPGSPGCHCVVALRPGVIISRLLLVLYISISGILDWHGSIIEPRILL